MGVMKSSPLLQSLSPADWEVFFSLAETGSFRRTAIDLGINALSVTRTVQRIEEAAGTTLFDRTSRPCVMTAQGRELYAIMHAPFRAFVQAVKNAEQRGRHNVALLPLIRIAGPTAMVQRYLIEAIGHFMAAFPNTCRFEVLQAGGVIDLLEGRCDLLISPENTTNARISKISIIHAQTVVLASPEYLLKHGIPKTPADLRHHAGMLKTPDLFPVSGCLVNEQTGETAHLQWKTQSWFADMNSLHQAVIAGLGITKDLALSHCVNDLEQGRLVPLLRAWRRPVWDFFMQYLDTGEQSALKAKVAYFVACEMRERLSADRRRGFTLVEQYFASHGATDK